MPIDRIDGILVCGNICMDLPVWPVDRLEWGKTRWVETVTESMGGNGANTSYALATLGVPVRLAGTVGDDPAGDRLLQRLGESGVDCSAIQRSSLPTTTTVVLVHPSGDRLFLHKPGSSGHVEASQIRFDTACDFTHFHLANPFALPKIRETAGELMAQAKSSGLTTSLDTGWDAKERWILDIGPCLPACDLIFVNEAEACQLTGCSDWQDAVKPLLEAGVESVVVKLGRKGCSVCSGERRTDVAGFAVDRVVDTTGAGDCFAGGFLAALARGMDYASAARVANAAGALNVQKLGAAQGVLCWDECLNWISGRDKLENHVAS